MTTCDGCGYVYEDMPGEGVTAAVLAAVPRYRDILGTAGPALVRRPEPSTWSALEYACHVRDVLLVQRDRVVRALVEEVPSFPPMHREERVALAGYAAEPPALVADELAIAAGLFARLFDRLGPEQLARRCVYGYPTPTEVDITWVGRHTLHEVVHHLLDAQRVLAGPQGAR